MNGTLLIRQIVIEIDLNPMYNTDFRLAGSSLKKGPVPKEEDQPFISKNPSSRSGNRRTIPVRSFRE
jgi:hypothetical protein